MAFFDQLTESISKFTKDIGTKAHEITDTAKLNARINDANNTIRSTYTAIGEAYYKMHKDDEHPEMDEQFQIIKEAFETVEECRKQIQKIKGVRICPNCGAEVAKGAVFCQTCGKKVPEEVIPEAEEIAEEIAEEAEEAAEAAEDAAEEIEEAVEDITEEITEEE